MYLIALKLSVFAILVLFTGLVSRNSQSIEFPTIQIEVKTRSPAYIAAASLRDEILVPERQAIHLDTKKLATPFTVDPIFFVVKEIQIQSPKVEVNDWINDLQKGLQQRLLIADQRHEVLSKTWHIDPLLNAIKVKLETYSDKFQPRSDRDSLRRIATSNGIIEVSSNEAGSHNRFNSAKLNEIVLPTSYVTAAISETNQEEPYYANGVLAVDRPGRRTIVAMSENEEDRLNLPKYLAAHSEDLNKLEESGEEFDVYGEVRGLNYGNDVNIYCESTQCAIRLLSNGRFIVRVDDNRSQVLLTAEHRRFGRVTKLIPLEEKKISLAVFEFGNPVPVSLFVEDREIESLFNFGSEQNLNVPRSGWVKTFVAYGETLSRFLLNFAHGPQLMYEFSSKGEAEQIYFLPEVLWENVESRRLILFVEGGDYEVMVENQDLIGIRFYNDSGSEIKYGERYSFVTLDFPDDIFAGGSVYFLKSGRTVPFYSTVESGLPAYQVLKDE